SEVAKTLAPLVRQVRTEELRRRHQFAGRIDVEPQSTTSAAIGVGGEVFLVGIATIAPSEGFTKGEAPAAVAITGRRLDRRFLDSLGQDLGIRAPKLA